MKVLVVDDEADILEAVSLMWGLEGIEVMTARSAEAALAMMAEELPDAVLTDYKMPGLDGLALIQAIHDDHPELPTLLMTAFSDEKLRKKALAEGASAFVPKPFDPLDALVIVTAAVEG